MPRPFVSERWRDGRKIGISLHLEPRFKLQTKIATKVREQIKVYQRLAQARSGEVSEDSASV